MQAKTFSTDLIIKEIYLDMFGHMNHAMYLTLFEQIRWDLITDHGYGVDKIQATGLGPVILGVNIQYFKELCLRDKVIVVTQLVSYEGKIGKIKQIMKKSEDICCSAEFTFGLFDLKKRKLILPTEEWLKALGL